MARIKGEGSASLPAAGQRTISVTASASVSAVPDIASLAARVICESETAADALARNNAAMNAVVDGLGNLGIASRDVQTASFQVEPRYAAKSPPGAAAQIAGYRVVNQLGIVVRQIDRLGDILDQLVRLGVNQMDSLSFEVSTSDKLMDEARAKAMSTALARARLLAAAAGAEVGQVVSIAEGGSARQGGPALRAAMMESVPIERGSASIDAQVSVTWALK